MTNDYVEPTVIDYRKYTGFMGNPRLRRPNTEIPLTQENEDEMLKCMKDPIYFATNYIKIVHVDKGLMNFEMWDFQKDLLNKLNKNRFVIVRTGRQIGKCVSINTPIKLRNKKTGEIIQMTIGEFYEKQDKERKKPGRNDKKRK
jgi:hypothetical protein